MYGIENLNKEIVKSLGFKADVPFDGKMMILTRNQSYFDLYNGDSGIVVNCSTRPILMLKRKGDFVFYPLSLLPSDSLEPSFAITIHKSQGSGYPNIMMFLPTRKGHPLLNRQILYTGVTRTKKTEPNHHRHPRNLQGRLRDSHRTRYRYRNPVEISFFV